MSRWSIAKDPKLLARIAEQESKAGPRNARVVKSPPVKRQGGGGEVEPAKSGPSAATKRAKRVALANQDSRKDRLLYDCSANTLTFILPGVELLSLNTSLRMHAAKATGLKNTWLKRMEALVLTNLKTYDLWKSNQASGFPFIVEELYATGENNCLDSESVTAACKPIIDAIVKTRFIPDDNPSYIAHPIGYTYRQPNNGLVLVFRPAPKKWGYIADETMELAKAMPSLST